MPKVRWVALLLAFALPVFATKSALDLMLEGRFGEARQMIDKSNLSPRYELLYYAMTEADAARACSLYQIIAIRYPVSDCDSVARERLDQARTMGFTVVPIAEWSQAPANAAPLFSQRVSVSAPTPPAPPVVITPEAPKQDSVVPPPEPPKAEEVIASPIVPVETPASVPVPVVSDQTAPASVPAPSAKRDTMATTNVRPKSEDLEPHDKPVESSGGKWFVQVGAFKNFDNAHKLSTSLQAAGYPVKLVPLEGKTKLLQVRVGGYTTRAELTPVMVNIKGKFNLPAAVVSE